MMVRYGSDEFRKSLEEIGAALRDGRHPCLVLIGGTSEDTQSALSALAEYTALSLNQRNAENFLGDRALQTQGNIREAFDDASKDSAILYIENADVVFADSERLAEEDELDDDAQKPVNYLIQRIEHIDGMTVLRLRDSTYLDQIRPHVDAVVQF